jgi:sister-chromatid-cohesion protein PDS5
MELFTVYAPDAPWSTQEVLEIFRQTIRQLANLAHTTNRNSPHFNDYERILDLLAQVKIAVILVEMTKEDNCREEALPVLADLFKTLLQSVRKEHPPQIPELIQQTLCGCLEEFHDGIMLPIPLIDELLVCVGQGSRVLVVNPNKALHKNQPLVEQTNPSFLVASSVIRSSVDRLATPIAALLNGLLNTDPRLMEESTISTQPTKELGKPAPQDQDMSADVFNIIYELHRVAPMVLTTIIGTLANFLESSHQEQRQWVIELLGRLFQQQPKFAEQFRACFRQWTERAKDKASEIRKIMVHHLVHLVVVCKSEYASVVQEAQTALKGMLVEDPDPQIRLACIHGICDNAYAHPSAVSVELLLSVGHKTGTKQKQERKDALTGLVQTYFQHYMLPRLEKVLQGGEDVSVQVVQETLEDTQLFESPQDNYRIKFEWIPTKVFEAASFQDDTDLNLRVWQAMDDMLLGSEISSKRKLTSTARAVGLAMIVGNLEENALAWLGGMLRERARLQQKLMEYMGARALIREFQPGPSLLWCRILW